MKTKEQVFETLRFILTFYENYRFVVNYSEEEAKKKTLQVYSDFYDWLLKEE